MKQLQKILSCLILLSFHTHSEIYSQSVYLPRYNPSINQNADRNDSVKNDTAFFEIPDTGIFKGALINFDEPPVFQGGEKALIDYILKNAIYPEAAVNDSVEGRVVLLFSIDVDGKTGDFKVYKTVREDIDNECIRVIKEMPLWKPGSTVRRAEKGLYHTKVKCWYTIGMNFSLSNEDKSGIIIKPKPDSSYFHRWY